MTPKCRLFLHIKLICKVYFYSVFFTCYYYNDSVTKHNVASSPNLQPWQWKSNGYNCIDKKYTVLNIVVENKIIFSRSRIFTEMEVLNVFTVYVCRLRIYFKCWAKRWIYWFCDDVYFIIIFFFLYRNNFSNSGFLPTIRLIN